MPDSYGVAANAELRGAALSAPALRLAIVDDHQIVLSGLEAWIGQAVATSRLSSLRPAGRTCSTIPRFLSTWSCWIWTWPTASPLP
jgi:hypothetical protein